MFWLCLEL